MAYTVIRWFVTPLAFAAFGLAFGLFVLLVLLPNEFTGRARNWFILIPLATISGFITYRATVSILRADSHDRTVWLDHLRHTWMAYPLWLLSSVWIAGSHVSIFYIYPFATLSGVLAGNLAAVFTMMQTDA